jgi:hypothetical protein
MLSDEAVACLMIALCICAKDGILSSDEEEKLFTEFKGRFSSFDHDSYEIILEDFFNSNKQLEDYMEGVNSDDMKIFTITLSETSASEDGLDIRENLALQIVKNIWGY